MWLKVHKTYRGGKSAFDYIQIDKNTDQEEEARNWAERSPGGKNYGWEVHWEEVSRPPNPWLIKEIISAKNRILNTTAWITELEKSL